jgi:hypothetical protein
MMKITSPADIHLLVFVMGWYRRLAKERMFNPVERDEAETTISLDCLIEDAMPYYEFHCEDCQKPFELILTFAEYEKGTSRVVN